jgi:isoleucyl-tRNA synthetase
MEKNDIAKREEKILKFWQENRIFEKSLEKESPQGNFIFYEGPPTANAKPGIHHLEARAFKDAIPRYKTMRGFKVRRKGGWDTHGLPVELEVEKALGLKSKKEIEEYGVAKFNRKCQESVWKYKAEWEKFTDRIAFWVDKENAYVTYKPKYIESVWHIIKHVWEKDLLYKDYKVVPWCPRCGTAISSHEVAQGYKDVKETSVTIEFKLEDEPQTFLLAWTTTPWTLLGNIALTVNPKLDYVKIEKKDEGVGELVRFILAKDRLEAIFKGDELKIVEEFKGSELVGRSYEPLFNYLKDSLPKDQEETLKKAFKVYPADFVSVEDGTGIVHTAAMYGADDFELGNEIGLPKYHLVNPEGKFTKDAGEFAGIFVKDADSKIIEALGGKLFSTEEITHTYPFCWRCNTPLIYYARDSWYIKMSVLRKQLISENQKINWEPEYIKEGRFGEWLREVKDWAISRERYWGTPLPIWECQECHERKVIGSVEELKEKENNKYFVMRHGGADSNFREYIDSGSNKDNHLTEEGKANVLEKAKELEDIDLIISSDILRAKETAEIVSKELDVKVIYDKRIREKDFGGYDGKTIGEYSKLFKNLEDKFETECPGGENRNDVRKRIGEFIYDINSNYKDKNILIISHGTPIHLLYSSVEGLDKGEILKKTDYFKNSETRPLEFSPIPHNDLYELDLHRPYIDKVELKCSCGGSMTRIKEVMDVWFDSGAMPFAQDHYPFENKDWVDGQGYPADYISEAIDQTRGWFYTLHAIGVLMDKGLAFKNVINLGHILDKSGKKMSKTIGNTVDPWEEIDSYGADILRFWMYTVNQPGESKNYDQKTVEENVRKVIHLLNNIYRFYETYSDEAGDGYGKTNILDKWIIAKLNEVVEKNTENLDNFKILEPGRRIREFINDFSTWYIRRSRERFKGDDENDKKDAILTTRYVLLELSKLMAPFTPFISEDIYRKVGGEKESVHLEDWPMMNTIDEDILNDMAKVRKATSLSLEARSKAGIKVRQPLQKVIIKSKELLPDLLTLIKEEVNVKEVICDSKQEEKAILDLKITPELKKEGQARDLVRHIQNLRKEENLTPTNFVSLEIGTDREGEELLGKFKEYIQKTAQLKDIQSGDGGKEVKVDNISFRLKIIK